MTFKGLGNYVDSWRLSFQCVQYIFPCHTCRADWCINAEVQMIRCVEKMSKEIDNLVQKGGFYVGIRINE